MMGVNGMSVIKTKAMNDLVEGYEVAKQAEALIQDGHGEFADELVAKILKSFDEIISDLSDSFLVSGPEGYSSDPNRREDLGEKRKRVATCCKNKRGSYKRTRKSHTWTVVSATLEDSHCWRKYGQKVILNAKFPRSYFRCTHKNTQGCKAVKQVQQLQDESENYQITYIGTHSCTPDPAETSSTIKVVFTNPTVIKPEETASGSRGDAVEDAADLSLLWNDDIMRFDDFGTFPKFSCNEANSYGMENGYGGYFSFEVTEHSFQLNHGL